MKIKNFNGFLNEIAASEPNPGQSAPTSGAMAGSNYKPAAANTPTEKDIKSLIGLSFRVYGMTEEPSDYDQKNLSGCAVDLKITEATPYEYNNIKDFGIRVKCAPENVVYGKDQNENEIWKQFVDGSKSFMIYGKDEYGKGVFDRLSVDGYGGFYSSRFAIWGAGELVPKLNAVYKTSFNFYKWKKDPRYFMLYASKNNNQDPEPTKSDMPTKSPAPTPAAPAPPAPTTPTKTPQPAPTSGHA